MSRAVVRWLPHTARAMQGNLALFEPPPQHIPPVQDQRVHKLDLPRLKGQNLRVLERLRQGPATNVQLAELLGAASGWRTRVSNVRVWLERHEGLTIKSERVREGIWSYRIEPR